MHWISRSSPLRAVSKDGSTYVTDEFYNTWIAIVGLVFAVAGCAWLLITSAATLRPWHVLGFGFYTFGIITLLVMSVLHHGIDGSDREEEVFRLLDYCAIFVMIAGSQSAFCLILMRNPLGWTLFGVEWALAILGIFLKTACPRVSKKITTGIYLLMGWLGVLTIYPLYRTLGTNAVLFLALGGILYTLGSAIFMRERPNPRPGSIGFHEIWHGMVVLASASHFIVMLYLLRA